MGYVMKPNKSVMSRFKVTRTGKLKRHHAMTSHLLSGRSAKRMRRLRQPAILSETLAAAMRRMMGVAKKNPRRAAHLKRVAMAQKAKQAAAASTA